MLAIHRYFWPDTPPYASLLRQITAHWAANGVRVDVLTSQPSYKPEVSMEPQPHVESIDGVTVRRLPMVPDRGPRLRKSRNMVRFSLLVMLRVLLSRRYDVVMCSTAPPVVLAWCASLAARLRGAQFVYHCMDVHPEIGRLSGEFANTLVYKALLRMDVATCRRAAAVVVLSVDMRAALLERDPALADSVVVINNFDLPSFEADDPDPDDPQAGDAHAGPEVLTIAFTGNVGRYQGLETLTEAVLGEDPALSGVRLVLMGEGSAKPRLERIVAAAPEERRERLRLLPHGTASQARAVMRRSDLGLVSLIPGVISFAYPSKTAAYLSEGLPVLAAVEPESSLARDITAWGIGGVLPAGSVEHTRAALLTWVRRREQVVAMRARAREVWHEQFSAEARLADWDRLLDNLVGARQ